VVVYYIIVVYGYRVSYVLTSGMSWQGAFIYYCASFRQYKGGQGALASAIILLCSYNCWAEYSFIYPAIHQRWLIALMLPVLILFAEASDFSTKYDISETPDVGKS